MLQGLERALEVTKKVLSAVPDSNRDFRLDPKSRTAGELAWHLASSDVQMLDFGTKQISCGPPIAFAP